MVSAQSRPAAGRSRNNDTQAASAAQEIEQTTCSAHCNTSSEPTMDTS